MSLTNVLEDSTTYKWLIRRGEMQGRQETILDQGEVRFGPPSDATRAAVQGIADYERLRRVSLRLLDATGWDDLLATE